MYWESDRDESLVSEMYGLSRLYVYPVDAPDPDADNQSYYQPDYLSENAVPVASLSMGDVFPTLDSLDQEFSVADVGVSQIVSESVAVTSQPWKPFDASASLGIANVQSVPVSSVGMPVDAPPVAVSAVSKDADLSPVEPIGDIFGSVDSLDSRFESYVGPSSMTGLSDTESMVGARPESSYETPVSLDFNMAIQKPEGISDRRPPRGEAPDTTASQYHKPHGQFGSRPIAGGGMPDIRFSSRQSDGTEFGDSMASSEAAMAIYVNNLTQALSLMAEVLVDHAQRIKDIEETIERSC